jgi:hypothetical protein
MDEMTRKRIAATPRPPRAGAPFYEPAEAAFVIGISTTTLARWRMHGRGPRFHRPAPRVVRYAAQDVRAWLGTSVQSTTEADAAA